MGERHVPNGRPLYELGKVQEPRVLADGGSARVVRGFARLQQIETAAAATATYLRGCIKTSKLDPRRRRSMNSGAHRQFAVWGNRVRAAARGDLRARPPGSVCTTALRCGAADDPIRERPPAALTGFARSEDRVPSRAEWRRGALVKANRAHGIDGHRRVADEGRSNQHHQSDNQGLRTGFDPHEAMRGPGLGLTSMKERLKVVGGQLSIHSQRGHGTTIHAVAPLCLPTKSTNGAV